MTDYISGKVEELGPTQVVIDNNGIGYRMEISLQTYAMLEGKSQAKVFVQSVVNTRDGGSVEYGFANKDERALFQLITSVSGMGAASARMVLSSFSAEEFRQAVLAENVNLIKSVKGLGLKTAQRLILELKDKVAALGIEPQSVGGDAPTASPINKEVHDEAVEALKMLGFPPAPTSKVVKAILAEEPEAPVERVIKLALKAL